MTSRLPLVLSSLGVLSIALCSFCVPTSGVAQEFTRAERAELQRGQPVRHPRTQQRSGHTFIGGTSWRVIPRPLAEVWRGINDSSSLCRMLPQCTEQRIVTRLDNGTIMRFSHEYGPISASYHLRITLDQDAHDLSFRLDESRSNDVEAIWGFLQLSTYRGDANRTLVSWGVMAEPGSQVVVSILGSALQDSLLRVPDEMYDYLVGPARNRYR